MKGIPFLIVVLFFITGHDFGNETIHTTLQKQGRTQDFESYTVEIPGSDAGIEMTPVPGGTFAMGPMANTSPEVRVDDFWIGTYEITWEQYDQFSKEVVSNLSNTVPNQDGNVKITADAISLPTPPYVDMSFGMGRDGYPAISMTHYAALMFTKWLSAKTGNFYRLPTEAEWEYACRAGSDSADYFDEGSESLDDYEWHRENSDGSYNRVGMKKPNPLGLYDMKGNIAEWTMDQYLEDYQEQLEGDPADNPWFKPTVLYPRSVRGGSWRDAPEEIHCAKRRGSDENWKILDPQFPKSIWWHTSAPFVGFRVVRPKETPSREQMEEYWIEPMEDL
ncbi:MAG: SUMF1/EgtB/PvdO family nonheme iron enzyme [Balneolaceae bacterium]